MPAHVDAVRVALARRGLRLDEKVRVSLRTADALKAMGLLTHPDQGGLTHMWAQGRQRKASIHMLAGLPPVTFRAVFAHEYVHAWLFLTLDHRLPQEIEEGLAEFIAYTFLIHDDASPQALRYAEEMLRNEDVVYGEGLRRVRGSVRQHGFSQVWRAVQRDDLASVGLGARAVPK